MNLEELKNLQLTGADFKLLVDGLDALPERGAAGEMMGDLISGMLMKDDNPRKEEMEMMIARKKREREMERDIIHENVRILQGKLFLMKRFLQENNLLMDADNIIKRG